jgi:aryl-alcohol dehydrogenase-like predicted oxidoreductase
MAGIRTPPPDRLSNRWDAYRHVIDLLQFHEVIRLDDPDVIFAPGGAIDAVQGAKQAGKIRYIGFTGHKDPSVHRIGPDCRKRRISSIVRRAW